MCRSCSSGRRERPRYHVEALETVLLETGRLLAYRHCRVTHNNSKPPHSEIYHPHPSCPAYIVLGANRYKSDRYCTGKRLHSMAYPVCTINPTRTLLEDHTSSSSTSVSGIILPQTHDRLSTGYLGLFTCNKLPWSIIRRISGGTTGGPTRETKRGMEERGWGVASAINTVPTT
jgi:hypothetical protein